MKYVITKSHAKKRMAGYTNSYDPKFDCDDNNRPATSTVPGSVRSFMEDIFDEQRHTPHRRRPLDIDDDEDDEFIPNVEETTNDEAVARALQEQFYEEAAQKRYASPENVVPHVSDRRAANAAYERSSDPRQNRSLVPKKSVKFAPVHVPAPAPARAHVPAPAPARAHVPAHVPARAHVPAHVPARAHVSAPAPARAHVPAPAPARGPFLPVQNTQFGHNATFPGHVFTIGSVNIGTGNLVFDPTTGDISSVQPFIAGHNPHKMIYDASNYLLDIARRCGLVAVQEWHRFATRNLPQGYRVLSWGKSMAIVYDESWFALNTSVPTPSGQLYSYNGVKGAHFAILTHLVSGRSFILVNCWMPTNHNLHRDGSDASREYEIELRKLMSCACIQFEQHNDFPIIIAGDFNREAQNLWDMLYRRNYGISRIQLVAPNRNTFVMRNGQDIRHMCLDGFVICGNANAQVTSDGFVDQNSFYVKITTHGTDHDAVYCHISL